MTRALVWRDAVLIGHPCAFFSASSIPWQCSWFFRDDAQSHEESLAVLRSNTEFLRYAVSVALQKVQQLEETGQTDGPDGQNPEKMFQNLCKITRWVTVERAVISPEKQQCILGSLDSHGFERRMQSVTETVVITGIRLLPFFAPQKSSGATMVLVLEWVIQLLTFYFSLEEPNNIKLSF